jgi:hypothetical protein
MEELALSWGFLRGARWEGEKDQQLLLVSPEHLLMKATI